MNTILLQNCKEFIQEVMEFFSGDKARAIEEMEKDLKELTNNFILEMMSTYLEALDKGIVEDKAGRRKKGIVLRQGTVPCRSLMLNNNSFIYL